MTEFKVGDKVTLGYEHYNPDIKPDEAVEITRPAYAENSWWWRAESGYEGFDYEQHLVPVVERTPGEFVAGDLVVLRDASEAAAGGFAEQAGMEAHKPMRVIDSKPGWGVKLEGYPHPAVEWWTSFRFDLAPETKFKAGNSVYYTTIPGLDSGPGTGVIEKIEWYENGNELDHVYRVRVDDFEFEGSWSFGDDDLSLLPPTEAPEPEVEKDKWTTVSKQLIGGGIEVRIQTRKVS